VSAGRGKNKPLMLFLHGFPELWFSWRKQMAEFKDEYEVPTCCPRIQFSALSAQKAPCLRRSARTALCLANMLKRCRWSRST
jgi:pimeloyl-ACP methyl ester carboxylesterase